MRYEYKHTTVPFSEEQILLIGLPLPLEQRQPLDEVLEGFLNEQGNEGWRVVTPLMLPVILFEREIQEGICPPLVEPTDG